MGKSGGEGCGREALFQKQNQDFPRIPRTKEAMQVTSQGNSHLLPSSSSASSPGRRGGAGERRHAGVSGSARERWRGRGYCNKLPQPQRLKTHIYYLTYPEVKSPK